MANPQIENGHTKIANEIMDALCCFRIPGEARQVLDCIIRHTWGWNKKTDKISLSQFVAMTGLMKTAIVRALSSLLTHNIIIQVNDLYSIQKDYEAWKRFDYGCRNPSGRSYKALNIQDNVNTQVNLPLTSKIPKNTIYDERPLTSKRTTKDSIKDTITKDIYIVVFDHWNNKKIIVHRELSDTIKKSISAKLKFYDVKEITVAIDNYKMILDDPNCWLKYRWSLVEFLQRGLEKCLDYNNAIISYKNKDKYVSEPDGEELEL